MMDQSHGDHALLTSPSRIFSFEDTQGLYLPNPDLVTVHRQIIEAIETVDVDMLKNREN